VNSTHFIAQESDETDEADEAAFALTDGQKVDVAGIIAGKTMKATKSNDMMCFLTLEDLYGTVEIIVFPKTMQRHARLLELDQVIAVSGRASFREEENGKVVAEAIRPLTRQETAGKLYVRLPKGTCEFARETFKGVLHKYPGACPVYVKDEDAGKNYRLGKEQWVRVNEDLLKDLGDLVGEECVKTGK
jgi:DNA polymerase-3 subunit alpha